MSTTLGCKDIRIRKTESIIIKMIKCFYDGNFQMNLINLTGYNYRGENPNLLLVVSKFLS